MGKEEYPIQIPYSSYDIAEYYISEANVMSRKKSHHHARPPRPKSDLAVSHNWY